MALINIIAEAKLKEVITEYNKLPDGETKEIIITTTDIIQQFKCSHVTAIYAIKLLQNLLQEYQFNVVYQRGNLIIKLEK